MGSSGDVFASALQAAAGYDHVYKVIQAALTDAAEGKRSALLAVLSEAAVQRGRILYHQLESPSTKDSQSSGKQYQMLVLEMVELLRAYSKDFSVVQAASQILSNSASLGLEADLSLAQLEVNDLCLFTQKTFKSGYCRA